MLTLLDNPRELVWIHTREGRILAANPAAYARYGFTRDSFLGCLVSDLVAPAHQGAFQSWMEQVLAQGNGHLACDHVHQDHSVFPVTLSASAISTDQGPLFLCVAREPEGQNLQTEAGSESGAASLAATCGWLSAALDQVEEAMAVLDAKDGTLLHANLAFSLAFGDPAPGALRPRLMDLIQKDEEGRALVSALEQACAGRAWTGRTSLITRTGRKLTFDTTLSPVRQAEGGMDCLIARFRDLSTELEKERLLREAQRLGALGALAGGVAHDFNNLIGAILGATDLINMQIEPQGAVGKKVQIIRQVCARAKELSTQILTFGRRTDASWAPLDLTALIEEVVSLLQTTLPPNVRVVSELAPGLRVLGDPSQLHQVIMNLCINGSQAMQPKGGVLSIGLRQAEPAPPGASPSNAPPRIQLTVADSGIGMDQPTLDRIFEPFFTTKAAGHGTGLGLSVVRGIIQGHGGNLHVASRPGRGSSFQILLPACLERRREPPGSLDEAQIDEFLGDLQNPDHPSARKGESGPPKLQRRGTGFRGPSAGGPWPAKDRPA